MTIMNFKESKMYKILCLIVLVILSVNLFPADNDIRNIHLYCLNPKYSAHRIVTERSLIEGSLVLQVIAFEENNMRKGAKPISDKFVFNTIGYEPYIVSLEKDNNVLSLYNSMLTSNYSYNPDDFNNNKAFLLCIIHWENSITYLSIDTDYRMHYNGKHIEYKEELIKAIMPYIPEEFLEHIILYIPINNTRKPNDPEKE